MIRVNLLPRELIQKKKVGAFVIFVLVSTLFTIFICVLLSLPLREEIQATRRRLEFEQLTLRKSQPILKELEDLKGKESQLQARLKAMKNLVASRCSWSQVLYEISRALPKEIWLTELTNEPQEKQQILTIKGSSLNKTVDISKFMENLTSSPLFAEVVLLGMTKTTIDKREVMDFTINCKLRGPRPLQEGTID
ncbi:MAG: PilN domain-containing protein [bacterium]